MKRRDFLQSTIVAGAAVGASGIAGVGDSMLWPGAAGGQSSRPGENKLTPPSKGKIAVAVVISQGVTMIDYAGPWEVFQDVQIPGRGADMDEQMPFQLYTVSNTTETVVGSGGLKLVPDYTFQTAPRPKVVVIPAQGGRTPAMLDWIRDVSKSADVVMSVCTGAFILAATGLIDGKSATTHHDFFDHFVKMFPNIELKRGLRFVEGPKFSTAGGLTSGIDLALRVVERYFGREVAQRTATYMEYQSKGWMV
jgi:transcriptional regulator GlxA family with amidase domain